MNSSNNFGSLQPLFKESYSRIKDMFKKKHDPRFVAQAQNEASENPQEFMDKMKNADISKVKGVAF